MSNLSDSQMFLIYQKTNELSLFKLMSCKGHEVHVVLSRHEEQLLSGWFN